jgi:hypothetical protein
MFPTRIGRAKAFRQENPTEKAITAARIYKIQPTTLDSSIKRAPTSGIPLRWRLGISWHRIAFSKQLKSFTMT